MDFEQDVTNRLFPNADYTITMVDEFEKGHHINTTHQRLQGLSFTSLLNEVPGMEKIQQLRRALHDSAAVVIGAGARLSTVAGLTYSGERFRLYGSDSIGKYGFRDMYSGGLFPFVDSREYWAWWSLAIYIIRYVPVPTDVYRRRYHLVQDTDYFVLTIIVDHHFQSAGFDKQC
jgi:NAD-dependent protein deacetylases, SIR2 family